MFAPVGGSDGNDPAVGPQSDAGEPEVAVEPRLHDATVAECGVERTIRVVAGQCEERRQGRAVHEDTLDLESRGATDQDLSAGKNRERGRVRERGEARRGGGRGGWRLGNHGARYPSRSEARIEGAVGVVSREYELGLDARACLRAARPGNDDLPVRLQRDRFGPRPVPDRSLDIAPVAEARLERATRP